MGTVHLTSSHHRLHIHERPEVNLEERIVLDADLLMRPIYNGREPYMNPARHTTRAALQGLMDLNGFNAAVSYGVIDVGGVPYIQMPKRAWGEITLGTPDNVVLGFSHDTRRGNFAFRSVSQWLEEEFPDGYLDDDAYENFCLSWSSAEKWRRFFEARIRRRITELRSGAELLRCTAQRDIDRSNTIAAILG